MIKAILFDMGGVVVRFGSMDDVFRKFQALGVADVEEYMGRFGQKGIFLDIELGKMSAQEWLRALERLTGREHISFLEAREAWTAFVRDVPQEGLNFIQTLRQRYKVYLASNTNVFVQDWARSADFSPAHKPITDYFDGLFCSHEMGLYKPDASFFQHILNTLGLQPQECLFLDDSPKNTQAAEQLGIQTLLVGENQDLQDALANLTL